MSLRHFWNLVPRAVRTTAIAIVCCIVLAGLVGGVIHGLADSRLPGHSAGLPILESIVGMGIASIVGGVLAIWTLCLGYVFADAGRRAMPQVLWTVIAALVPNLLGFLLYFALRRPVTMPCTNCGHAMGAAQRFCSQCGREGGASTSGDAHAQSGFDASAAV